MQVDPISAARVVAQHGAAAAPRGTSDAAAAQAGEESRFEKLRRERSGAGGAAIRALYETDAADNRVTRSEQEGQGSDLGVQKRRDDRDGLGEDEQGQLVDYSA